MLWTALFDTEQYTGATKEGEREKEMFKTSHSFRQLPVYSY